MASTGPSMMPCMAWLDQIQIWSPTDADVKRAMQCLPGAFFALTGDVAGAQWLVKIDQQGWRFLACHTGVKPKPVWINLVGTFGVASAAYHRGRLLFGIGRAAFHLLDKLALSHLVYVDDFLWFAGEKGALEHVVPNGGQLVWLHTAISCAPPFLPYSAGGILPAHKLGCWPGC